MQTTPLSLFLADVFSEFLLKQIAVLNKKRADIPRQNGTLSRNLI